MEVVHQSMWVRWVKWVSRMIMLTVLMVLIGVALIVVALLYLRSQPLPPYPIHETTTIYAADGQVLDKIHQGQNRTYVPLEQIPEHVVHAALAVEDQRFFQHFGIDVKRVLGASVSNIKEWGYVEGASTISQQLARNLYLNHEKTWERKLTEAVYTLQLEMHYSKKEILEFYLNQIYFGHSAYGVEEASQLFFGKSVRELSIAEGALLMGVPKGPRYFSPRLNLQNALDRQALILRLMYEHGYISYEERQQALAEELVFLSAEEANPNAGRLAPYFRDYIRYLVTEKYGIDEKHFEQGGLRIYTTLDPWYQQAAEEAMAYYLPIDRELQGALVAVEPNTGYILAMVGGKEYRTSPFNRVFAQRQPGSSIKPYLYYTALEQGFTPLTLMRSEPTTFTYDDGRATYTPRNFNDAYEDDYITMERAIAKSDNIYAVKTLQYVGEEAFIEDLYRFGLEGPFRPLPSLALGAQNVTLFDMVKGYSVLANEGKRTEPIAILRIEDRQGNVLVEERVVEEQVLDPAHTFILNRMLRSVFEPGGTGHRVSSMLNRPVAGKTGSTDTDAWMIGYTPQLVAGVWVGYDQNQFINHNNDGRLAAQIWASFIEASLAEEMPALFTVPEGVVGAYINPDTGKLATEHCPVIRLLYFKQGTEPTEFCHDHIPLEQEPAHLEPVEAPEPSSIWEKLKEWWEG